jgi:predicted PurR-regulated permease PerM
LRTSGLGPKVGIILLVFALLTTVVDNFVRPAVIRGSANLHPLIAFVAAFGGLTLLGFPGIFLGPILAGLAVEVLGILFPDPTEKSQRR